MIWILFLIYGMGMVSWAFIWKTAHGPSLLKENRLLILPYIIVFAILAVQPVVAYLYSIKVGTVETELTLIRIIESNTLQLIQSNVGVLIVAPIIISIIGKKIPRDFIVFQALSIVFIAGGVLPIYWTPSIDGTFLYYIRHIKTIPYTMGIGCLMVGVIILLRHLVVSDPVEKD